jgi:hypothetical protein
VDRRSQALRAPDETAFDFGTFPRRAVRAGTRWFRQHRDRADADRGAWFFAGHAAGEEGMGRFDLITPRGTCYLASTERGAVNELIGPEAAGRGWVDSDLIAGHVVSTLRLPVDVRTANVTAERAARFRVTRELVTSGDYGLTQQWAEVLRAAGFGGILSELRFTLGTTKGLAFFGDEGRPDPPLAGDPAPRPVRPLVEGYGIDVVDPPALASVTVVTP